MPKAIWNGTVIAESDDTVVVVGNHYFPADSIAPGVELTRTSTRTRCPWKGEAGYYTTSVDGEENPDAAWFYPDPKSAAAEIKDRLAFWRGVRVEV